MGTSNDEVAITDWVPGLVRVVGMAKLVKGMVMFNNVVSDSKFPLDRFFVRSEGKEDGKACISGTGRPGDNTITGELGKEGEEAVTCNSP